jgi:hypothetical protein
MKVLLFSLWALAAQSQDSICLQRGHIVINGWVTSAYCPPYTIDTDSTSILVYPACNSITGTCERCNKEVTQMEKEQRTIIWKKEPK